MMAVVKCKLNATKIKIKKWKDRTLVSVVESLNREGPFLENYPFPQESKLF